MIDLHWSTSFVGIPFAELGRVRDGADCWGLAKLVYAEKLGIALPSYADRYASTGDRDDIARVITDVSAGPEWQKVTGRHRPFDVLVFRRGRLDSHVGLNVQPGVMLHMADEEQARIESYANERWGKRFVAAYRHRDVRLADILPAPANGDSIRIAAVNERVRVAAGPAMTPDGRRPDLVLRPGWTIDEIVARAFPGALPEMIARATVVLVSGEREMVIDRLLWSRVRPREGVLVDIQFTPAGDKLKSILGVVVAIAAIAVGTYLAPVLAGAGASAQALQVWQGILGLGVVTLGTIAINALVPTPSTEQREAKPNYQISGWRNALTPDGVVPSVMGRHRFAPPFAFAPYTEIEDGKQFVNAVFNFGYGRLALQNHRIGETPLADFEGFRMQVRDGQSGDDPLDLFRRQVIEEAIGTELLNGHPILRTLARDCSRASIILLFPQGMVKLTDKGKENNVSVQLRIRSRPVGEGSWSYTKVLTIRNRTRDPYYQQHSWKLEPRGLHEVEVTRLTEDSDKPEKMDRVQFVALQSVRPEYWNNFASPLCLVGLRIKASFQLTGGLDSYNAVATRVCLDWDRVSEAWVMRETSNPASLSRHALQGPQNAKPKSNDEIDLATLQVWHEFCDDHGLRYDRVHDFDASQEDTLVSIAAAGRASPRHDGKKWTWVIDRPKTLVVDEFNARNSRSFRWETSYGDLPHAVRVSFLDRENDYGSAERIVPRPGFSGDITITEQLDLPGKTGPDEIYLEARRKMYEARYRSTTYRLTVDSVTRPSTRGDLVMLNYDVLQRFMKAARVVAVSGLTVVLDDIVEMEDGTAYAIRWRWYSDEEDETGESVVRPVHTSPGEHRAVTLKADDKMPEVGTIVHFGPLATESLPVVVKSIERGEDMTSIYTLIATSDLIDADTDAEVIPAWSSRVGTDLDGLSDVPQEPEITRVLSGRDGTGDRQGLLVFVEKAEDEVVDIGEFDVDHRKFGDVSWSTVTIAASEAAADIGGIYTDADVVQLRARARSEEGTNGLYGDVVTITMGADDGDVPGELTESISVIAGLGYAVIEGSTGSDEATAQIQVYRTASDDPDDLDRDADAVGAPFLVAVNRAFSFTDGDPSRANLIKRGDFSSGKGWSQGGGWSIGDGVATHSPGSSGALSRGVALTNGGWYRLRLGVEDRTNGNILPRLVGGTEDADGTLISSNGDMLDRWQNPPGSGNDTFSIFGSAGFDGSVDDVVLFKETAACIDQGQWYYWLEPQNGSGVPGPLAGPFPAIII